MYIDSFCGLVLGSMLGTVAGNAVGGIGGLISLSPFTLCMITSAVVPILFSPVLLCFLQDYLSGHEGRDEPIGCCSNALYIAPIGASLISFGVGMYSVTNGLISPEIVGLYTGIAYACSGIAALILCATIEHFSSKQPSGSLDEKTSAKSMKEAHSI